MKIRPVLVLLTATAAVLLFGWFLRWVGPNASESRTRPDVILLTIDTLRRDHLPFYGYQRPTAPHLSQLAREAVVFEDTVTAHTNTAPSHASIMTGLFPSRHGIQLNGYALADGVPTLAELLNKQGYRTGGFVSGHTLNHEVTKLGRGFDNYDDGDSPRLDRQAQVTVDTAIDWLESVPPADNVFLFVHLFDPHYPYRAPRAFNNAFMPAGQDAYRFPASIDFRRVRTHGPKPGEAAEYIARYDAEIAYADAQMGRLLDDLKRRGRYNEAIIVFVSDHGETLNDRRHMFDHGGQAYDEQIRAALLARLPRGAHGGLRVRGPAHHIDVLPTVLEVVGAQLVSSHGVSLAAFTKNGRDLPTRPLFSLARPESERVPHIRPPVLEGGRALVTALRAPPLKLIRYPTADGFVYEVFNLERDPDERHNLAGSQPALVEKLALELERWEQSTGGQELGPPPHFSPATRKALKTMGYIE